MEGVFGTMLREARHSAGLTLEDVAARVGVTAGALSHIESGKRLPHPQNAIRIAQVLAIPADEMLRALDEAHSRRRETAAWSSSPVVSPGPEAIPSDRRGPDGGVRSGSSRRAYRARPISALFDASSPDAAAPARTDPTGPSSRDAARWSDVPSARLRALDDLAAEASEAIRTLRGLLDDEDPVVSREARRLLRELDVRLPEE